jgi:hypothetical protein
MTCIYTGARVHVLNYNALLVCDLFAVGNVIIANEGKNKFQYDVPFDAATHKVNLEGDDCYVHDAKCIAAPAAQWTGERR